FGCSSSASAVAGTRAKAAAMRASLVRMIETSMRSNMRPSNTKPMCRKSHQLRWRHVDKPLGASHVAAVVIGATVGVGIFFTPATVAMMLPSPAWIVALWMIGGVIAIAGAFVFSDLAKKHPNAGGVYVFLREGLGPRTAF